MKPGRCMVKLRALAAPKSSPRNVFPVKPGDVNSRSWCTLLKLVVRVAENEAG